MNISSIVVLTLVENCEAVIEVIKQSDFAEYHLHQDGKIIVTIEGESTDEEIRKLKQLEEIPNVISAYLHYSFCEDELDKERDKLLGPVKTPEWLNNDEVNARNIPYSGTVK